ncbi:MAG: hypothetical protein JWQ69_398 [Pseudomonas sp.]|nr:hypothetical protein [Pseudomonas sp.]
MNHLPQQPGVFQRTPTFDEALAIDAPDVKVAFHDEDTPGLLPISELNNPIAVDLFVWPAARPRYTYQLMWDGNRLGPEKEISDTDQAGDPLTLEIPVDVLSEGPHELRYRIYNPFSQLEEFSEKFDIVIDLTAPGEPQLAPMEFPIEVQGGLTSAELTELGNQLDVQIAGYTGMAKHDQIQTYWGTVEGPLVTVDADDMGLNKVVVTFTRDFLEQIGSDEQPVKYVVTDRAGNVSIDSDIARITLLLEEVPTDLPAPVIDPAVGDLVDLAEAQVGVKVDIPHYVGASAFDEIKLYWGNTPMLAVPVPPGNEDDDPVLTLVVPYETINVVPVGTVDVKYEVYRQGHLVGTSLPDVIEVFLEQPIPEPLDALTVQGTSVTNPNLTDNFIDEDDYELNGRAIVAWKKDFAVSDDLNLFWGEQQKPQWYQIRVGDVTAARDLVIPIDNDIMKDQGTGAEIPVYFTVTRTGNPNPSKSPIQTVIVRSKEELPGGIDGLDGPTFKTNSAGYVAPPENPNGADVTIAPYININNDQKLFFTFKGFDDENNPIPAADYTSTRELDDVDVINGYVFTVPHRNLRTVCSGFGEAYFRVEPADGSNQSPANSRVTRVPINMLMPSELACSI